MRRPPGSVRPALHHAVASPSWHEWCRPAVPPVGVADLGATVPSAIGPAHPCILVGGYVASMLGVTVDACGIHGAEHAAAGGNYCRALCLRRTTTAARVGVSSWIAIPSNADICQLLWRQCPGSVSLKRTRTVDEVM